MPVTGLLYLLITLVICPKLDSSWMQNSEFSVRINGVLLYKITDALNFRDPHSRSCAYLECFKSHPFCATLSYSVSSNSRFVF